MSDELSEEFDVLESIYPTEISRISDREITIDVEPEDLDEGEPSIKASLHVIYPAGYPDELPTLSLTAIEGELTEDETSQLLDGLASMGTENLGMAMTFTLVSHLRESLSSVATERARRAEEIEREKERLAIEAEEAKTRGTPVTLESFTAWKVKFDAELAAVKQIEDEEKAKALTPKEREEWRRLQFRVSGRQLFERNRHLEEDESLVEEEGVSVDFSQYERVRPEEDAQNDKIEFDGNESE